MNITLNLTEDRKKTEKLQKEEKLVFKKNK